MRVLCVDDDVVVRAVTGDLLRELGHDVVEAGDGPAALELITDSDSRIDLLITDVRMPGMGSGERRPKNVR